MLGLTKAAQREFSKAAQTVEQLKGLVEDKIGKSGDVIVPPSRLTHGLKDEHFVGDVTTLRYPATLDFSHANFKLRDISLLAQVPKGAPQTINLGGNELTSLEEVNRFPALRSLVACANSLQVGGGLILRNR